MSIGGIFLCSNTLLKNWLYFEATEELIIRLGALVNHGMTQRKESLKNITGMIRLSIPKFPNMFWSLSHHSVEHYRIVIYHNLYWLHLTSSNLWIGFDNDRLWCFTGPTKCRTMSIHCIYRRCLLSYQMSPNPIPKTNSNSHIKRKFACAIRARIKNKIYNFLPFNLKNVKK